MLNKKALAATAAAQALYVEDVFSTYLWTGTGATKTITNDIDLSGEGGMVWAKKRSLADNHFIFDTERGAGYVLKSNTTDNSSNVGGLTSFNNNGFTIDDGYTINGSGDTIASWTFRKAEKFFDVVTYTGNGSNRTIAHNLGSVPGCIIVKRADTTGAWQVYHRANTAAPETDYLVLNTTAATVDSDTRWNDTLPTSTVFSLGTDATVNANSGTYVAYLFAHDAGGFGANGTDNVITCGSLTSASAGVDINLGYEPQFVILKSASTADTGWIMLDTMRGWIDGGANESSAGVDNVLEANLSNAESSVSYGYPTSTGFFARNIGNGVNYIYIAIRRGPMKTPEAGTEVFSPVIYTGDNSNTRVISTGFPPDMVWTGKRSEGVRYITDRLRGLFTGGKELYTSSTADEQSGVYSSPQMSGWQTGDGTVRYQNDTGVNYVLHAFRRFPKVFDIVCYSGNGTNRTITHNLGVTPELMIVKIRNDANHWAVYHSAMGNTKYLRLNQRAGQITDSTIWNNTSPTSSVFSLGTSDLVNKTGGFDYVAYLFASLSGVSKVGSYTGNGSSQTINCGFTGGARFVFIRRRDSGDATDLAGNWILFDSARGIVSGNDPYLITNTSVDAEVTDKDAVDTDSTGFVVNETSGPNVNTNSATYIYFAIA